MTSNISSFAFIDIDGTLIKGQSQLLFIKFLKKRNKISLYHYSLLLLWFILYKLGISSSPRKALSFALKEFIGRNESEIQQLAEDFFREELKDLFYKDGLTLVSEIKESGETPVLVSNVIHPIVNVIARYLQIEKVICTQLEVLDGRITGKIEGMTVYAEQKKIQIEKFLSLNNGDAQHSSAYGDHHTDIFILEYVGKPYAVNPTKKLLEFARINNWPVINFK